jgi:hypothetical protein
MCRGQNVHEAVLAVVRVLVLVDVDILEAPLVAVADLGEQLEEGYGLMRSSKSMALFS